MNLTETHNYTPTIEDAREWQGTRDKTMLCQDLLGLGAAAETVPDFLADVFAVMLHNAGEANAETLAYMGGKIDDALANVIEATREQIIADVAAGWTAATGDAVVEVKPYGLSGSFDVVTKVDTIYITIEADGVVNWSDFDHTTPVGRVGYDTAINPPFADGFNEAIKTTRAARAAAGRQFSNGRHASGR